MYQKIIVKFLIIISCKNNSTGISKFKNKEAGAGADTISGTGSTGV
jgi:hypothetical protein